MGTFHLPAQLSGPGLSLGQQLTTLLNKVNQFHNKMKKKSGYKTETKNHCKWRKKPQIYEANKNNGSFRGMAVVHDGKKQSGTGQEETCMRAKLIRWKPIGIREVTCEGMGKGERVYKIKQEVRRTKLHGCVMSLIHQGGAAAQNHRATRDC